MPLLDRNKFPPGGFLYREPKLNWPSAKSPLAPGLPFNLVAAAIQTVRLNNPAAGLNPSREACEDALDLYTCTRLHNNPSWCVAVNDPVAKALVTARKAVPCGGCGKRRVKAAA